MVRSSIQKQPWLHGPVFDALFITLPGFLALFITLLLPVEYRTTDEMPIMAWLVLILLIDVAHVYSTLFQTYWNKDSFAERKVLYLVVPVVCYVVGVLLYSFDSLVFWRCLAYLAVFHFVRQQYGFMRLYSRFEVRGTISRKIDAVAIYAGTLYPIIFWHCTPGRNFNWFIEGDFVSLPYEQMLFYTSVLYWLIIAAYIIKEAREAIYSGKFNLPKNLIIVGTFLSWYFGIVYFNGDMAFTLLNVVAHGIPYMALIWLTRERREKTKSSLVRPVSFLFNIIIFLGATFLFAYIEEGLWDGMIWREHKQLFSAFNILPVIRNREMLALLVPLLSLPQATHYVLDGFIWRKKDKSLPGQNL